MKKFLQAMVYPVAVIALVFVFTGDLRPVLSFFLILGIPVALGAAMLISGRWAQHREGRIGKK